jgi:phage-related protein
MGKSAVEDQQGQARLATALKNTAGATDGQVASVEKWITAQGKALGVADDDLRPALAKLSAATHDVGKSQKLASLAMDISAGSGKSLETVSKSLANAYNGNVAGLSKLGIKTKDAEGKTIDFETAQRRLSATFKGQAAKNADTVAGKFAILKLRMSEAGETIGGYLIPIAGKVAGIFLDKVIPGVEQFASTLGQKLAPLVAKAKDAFAAMADKLKPVGAWFKDHPELIKGAAIALGVAAVAAAALAVALGAVALVTSPITLTIVAIAALGAGIALLWKNSETFRDVMTSVGKALAKVPGMFMDGWREVGPALGRVADFLMKKWGEIQPQVKKLWAGVIDVFKNAVTIVKVYIKVWVGIIKTGIDLAERLWKMFGGNILSFLKSTFRNLFQIVKGAFQIVQGIFKIFAGVLTGDWSKAWDGIKEVLKGAWNVIAGFVKQGWNVIVFAFKNAGVVVKLLMKKLWAGIKFLTAKAWLGLKITVHKGWDWIAGLFKKAATTIKSLTIKLWNLVKSLHIKAWELLKSLAKKGWDKLIDFFKSAPGRIKSLAGKYADAGRWIMSKLWDIIKAKAAEGAQWLHDQIASIPGKIRALAGKFKEAGAALIGAIADGIKNAAGFATDFAGQIWNAIKSAVNAGIDQLNNLLEFSFKVHGVGITVNAPDIGHLARGTNNWRGGLTVVGEEGPELVDLPRGSRVTPHDESMGRMRSLGGGDTYVFNLYGVTDGASVERALIKHARRVNRPLQVKTL